MVRFPFGVAAVASLILSAAAMLGQTARDLPRGASKDDAVRAYGWPKGRAATEDREIWTYESFSVIFANERVEHVAVLPAASPAVRQSRPIASPSRAVAPDAKPVAYPPPRSPSTEPRPRSGGPATVGVSSQTSAATPASPPPGRSPPVNPVQAARAPASRPVTAGDGVWRVLAHVWWIPVVAIIAAGSAIFVRRKVRGYDELLRQSRGASTEPSSTAASGDNWKATIAQQLNKSVEQTVLPAPSEVRPADAAGHQPQANAPGPYLSFELLCELEWKRFELIVARYFSATGLRAELTCGGADGGVDIYLYAKGEARPFSYVQCKAYAPTKYVEAEKVRALHGAMAGAKIGQGVFVTTSDFGGRARAHAMENGIETISGMEFVRRFNDLAESARTDILAEVTAGDYVTPTCPTHDIKLVTRRRGADGAPFWACQQRGCRVIINTRR